MSRSGRGEARRRRLLDLIPPTDGLIVDVGADHGRVALAAGALAIERQAQRIAGPAPAWLVADGLSALDAVEVGILAGMGWRTITAILAGPTPVRTAVLHAQDDPRALRTWLGAHGWRIVDEGLAPEGRGFAEVLSCVPGREPTEGLVLRWGPILRHGREADFAAWLAHHRAHCSHVLRKAPPDTAPHQQARADLTYLDGLVSDPGTGRPTMDPPPRP